MFDEEVNPENGAVSDTCDNCGETVWYDPNDENGVSCDDSDLAVEHECDEDEDEEE